MGRDRRSGHHGAVPTASAASAPSGGAAAPQAPAGIVAMGDFGHERCGVGSSTAALASRIGGVLVLDTAAPGFVSFVREARRLARSTSLPCAVEYPTRSTVYSWELVPRVLALRAVFSRRRLRFHVHELRHLRRKLRWPVLACLVLAGRVVVSSESERRAAAGAWRGGVGRRVEVVVAPPTNGTAPTGEEQAAALAPRADRARTVGVFGMRRPDKAADWLIEVLRTLPGSFDRLVLAGEGWELQQWPDDVRQRYEIVSLGHVPRPQLPGVLGAWGLAVAPLWEPAQDGRMSLRTVLAHGVPTLSVGPRTADLTLDVAHLALVPPADAGDPAVVGTDRAAGAAAVASFEAAVTARLAAALFGPATR